MTDALDPKLADPELELTSGITALAEENAVGPAVVDRAQMLAGHRQAVDQLVGQTLMDAMRLAELQEEIHELRAQKEALGHIVNRDAEAMKGQLQQVVSSLQGALEVLSRTKDIGGRLEADLSSWVAHLESLELTHGRDPVVHKSGLQSIALSRLGGEEGGHPDSAGGSPGAEATRQETRDSLPMTSEGDWQGAFESQAEMVAKPGGKGQVELVQETAWAAGAPGLKELSSPAQGFDEGQRTDSCPTSGLNGDFWTWFLRPELEVVQPN